MNKLTGTILTFPKMSGNVGAKTINIGEDGATFIPSVSSDGIISWTNDKDLHNPEPVNIKGVKGDKGDPGTNGKDGYTPVKGVDYFDGKDGKDGSPGVDGSDGVSATHSWNGTTLTITSASGTSSADLKGEKGFSPIVTTERDEVIGLTKVSILDEQDEDIFFVYDGHTPQKGVDYFTPDETDEFIRVISSSVVNGDDLRYVIKGIVQEYIEGELLGGAW